MVSYYQLNDPHILNVCMLKERQLNTLLTLKRGELFGRNVWLVQLNFLLVTLKVNKSQLFGLEKNVKVQVYSSPTVIY